MSPGAPRDMPLCLFFPFEPGLHSSLTGPQSSALWWCSPVPAVECTTLASEEPCCNLGLQHTAVQGCTAQV